MQSFLKSFLLSAKSVRHPLAGMGWDLTWSGFLFSFSFFFGL